MSTSAIESQHSKFSFPKIAIAVTIIIPLGYLLGYVYGLITSVMPFVYLNFICTVFLGTALGYVAIFSGYITKQTHRASEYLVTALGGIITWYFSWIAYVLSVFKDQFTSLTDAYFSDFTLVFRPLDLFTIMSDINTHGLWEINDVPLNGFTLTFIWIVEALLIIGIPITLLSKQHERPFSFAHNKWYREFILDKDFASVYGRTDVRQGLKENPVHMLENIGFGKANLYTQVSIYYLEEESVQYLSLFDVRIDRNDKTEKNEIIHMLEISTQDAKEIIDTWRAKKSLVPFL